MAGPHHTRQTSLPPPATAASRVATTALGCGGDVPATSRDIEILSGPGGLTIRVPLRPIDRVPLPVRFAAVPVAVVLVWVGSLLFLSKGSPVLFGGGFWAMAFMWLIGPALAALGVRVGMRALFMGRALVLVLTPTEFTLDGPWRCQGCRCYATSDIRSVDLVETSKDGNDSLHVVRIGLRRGKIDICHSRSFEEQIRVITALRQALEPSRR